jgi:hypothetical protein
VVRGTTADPLERARTVGVVVRRSPTIEGRRPWRAARPASPARLIPLPYKWAGAIRFEHRVDHSTGAQGASMTITRSAPGDCLRPTQHLFLFGAIVT